MNRDVLWAVTWLLIVAAIGAGMALILVPFVRFSYTGASETPSAARPIGVLKQAVYHPILSENRRTST